MTLKSGTLWVVKTAEELSDSLQSTIVQWSSFNKQTVGMQLVRAADSIGANIAEGYGRTHRQDALRFYSIARGSLEETLFWLKRCRQRKLLTERDCTQWLMRYYLLSKSLNKFIGYHKSKLTPTR